MSDQLDPRVREAITRFAAFLPHARLAAAMSSIQRDTTAHAQTGARGVIFIGYKNPDGTGRTTASFDSAPFCDDIETLLRALDPSALDNEG